MKEKIESAKRIVIVQAENPDGDSLGSALALEQILNSLGKEIYLHCPVQVPTYLRYIKGWDRVSIDFVFKADLAIIVDTTSKVLMSKTLDRDGVVDFFEKTPTIVLDHHSSAEPDLLFKAEYLISDDVVSTGEIIYDIAKENKWEINLEAATNLFISIQSDTLGLSTEQVTSKTFEICADLIKLGANPYEIENARRELMKKSKRILEYKGKLIERITYHADDRLAVVRIPFEEIAKFSDEYNPTVLVLEEMRQVTGVDVAIGLKTYPDGKFTAKIRSNLPVSDTIAGFFGGGGHPYAAGFRIYEDDTEKAENELIGTVDKILLDYDKEVKNG